MSRTYLVQMPKAEARYLADVGAGWPATPEARCVHAVREWLDRMRGRKSKHVTVDRIIDDLDPILGQVPLSERPMHGPFASRGGSLPLPGRVEYLGGGVVRLDDAAVSALAELREGEDFRVILAETGPVVTVGTDCYLVHAEEPDSKP